MYAAAGGASLASRKARQGQKNRKAEAAKLANKAVGPTNASKTLQPPQSRGFHHLSPSYQSSTLMLSRVERGALKPPAQNIRRHSSTLSTNNLKEPQKPKIRESPSMLIPLHNHMPRAPPKSQPLTPTTLVQNHIPFPVSPSYTLPQIKFPECEPGKENERRCSLVRQCEEAEKNEDQEIQEKTILVDLRDVGPDGNLLMYTEFDRHLYGSLEYPMSECSQGRAAWQERERERRCSLSEAATHHRQKQTEAHLRWMSKRNRIHDTSYGGSSDEEDFFSIYYQSAAANALLYVGLGTTAIGLVISSVASGEKGFKTLELRLIGPTLIALGLFFCVIRVLLCICPSTCFRKRKKTRLKKASCPHRFNKESRKPRLEKAEHFLMTDQNASLLTTKNKKRVSIAPNPVPCTSQDFPGHHLQAPIVATTMFLQNEITNNSQQTGIGNRKQTIPTIEIPDFADFNITDKAKMIKEDSLIELQNLELSSLEVSSVSSCESDNFNNKIIISDNDNLTNINTKSKAPPSKLKRARQPKLSSSSTQVNVNPNLNQCETSLSLNMNTQCEVLDDRPKNTSLLSNSESINSGNNININRTNNESSSIHHSGIVLSPSKLGQ